jgi:hypothetical protein
MHFSPVLARAKLQNRQTNKSAKSAREILTKNVRNRWVHFRINEVYIPEPAEILMQLHGKDLLQGKIIDISDNASQEDAYAVVEVEGLSQPVVVAMKHIKEILCE